MKTENWDALGVGEDELCTGRTKDEQREVEAPVLVLAISLCTEYGGNHHQDLTKEDEPFGR